MSDLSMTEFLLTVRDFGMQAEETLIDFGHQPKVVMAKAERASRRGYTDSGTVPTRCWLTPKGESYLTD